MYVGCLRIQYFDDMICMVMDRTSGWANYLLCFGGKLMLVRHVFSTIPLHLFHVIQPSAIVIQHLDRLFARFLCDDTDSQWCIHWFWWPSVCFLMEEGGLGIRSFYDLAEALELKL